MEPSFEWSRFVSLVGCILASAVLVGGCGEPAESTPKQATFATYNAGLARGFVDHATARMQPAADAIAKVDAEAVCLQEIWLAQDDSGEWTNEQIEAVTSASSEAFPHTYWERTKPPDETDEPACTQAESEPLRTCVEQHCAGVADDQLSGCALENCGEPFQATSSECQSCIAANLGKSIDGILLACRGGGASLTSNGHNGLLLLSRHPFEKTEFTEMESTVARRSALHAVVDVPSFGRTDLYCTHLAAKLSALEYPGSTYDSYEAEQAAQIETLLQWIDDTRATDRVVLMGDMNNGPGLGGLQAELAGNYRRFPEAGYRNPYLEQDRPKCTYCGSNTMNDGSAKKAIDHVLFDFGDETDALAVPTTERILDAKHEIETADGTQSLHLSDHFGVRTTIERPK